MKIYTFNYNIQYVNDLRNAVNNSQKFSLEKEHTDKDTKGPYLAWDRICAIMDRLEDTLQYVNDIELGKCTEYRSAFDFYEFIHCSAVIIDGIKTIGKIFDINTKLIQAIEESTEAFGSKYSNDGQDSYFFEYARSLCAAHPFLTNRQKAYLVSSNFHCCPFVLWNSGKANFAGFNKGDLTAVIYDSKKDSLPLYLPLYVKSFETYLGKWINLIPEIIKAKEHYAETKYAEFKSKRIKDLSEFADIISYLEYLKEEYISRIDAGSDYIFDQYIRIFKIQLSDPTNLPKLEKYKNAIIYSLDFYRNALQNMCFEGVENTGIYHESIHSWNDLFTELSSIYPKTGLFAPHTYYLSKLCDLEPNRDFSDPFHRDFARDLINELKPLINRYVSFTNNEPDEEVIVLVNLTLYLEALDHCSCLNPNIPNKIDYRERILTPSEWDYMIEFLDKQPESQTGSNWMSLEEMLELYGE